MIVARMLPEHIPGVKALLDGCFGSSAWSVESITEELNKPEAACAVVLDGRRVVAYLAFERISDEGSIIELAVAPGFRRQGIARRLCELMLSACEGLSAVFLEVRASNTPAIELYKSLGFVEVSTRKDYYRSPREDAIIMRKSGDNR